MTRFDVCYLVGLLGLSVFAVSSSSGCYVCEEGAVCNDDRDEDSDRDDDFDHDQDDLCTAFCGRLTTCGVIGASSQSACIDDCRKAVKDDPDRASGGARCVVEDACRVHYECPGAPIPGGSSGGSQGSSSGGSGAAGAGGSGAGGSSAGGGGAGGEGAVGGGGGASCGGEECVAPQECVDGSCKLPCTQSCQCPEGESCEAGYCGPADPEPNPCTDDCDCPSGQTCDAGTCV